jgi:hypothetical protein
MEILGRCLAVVVITIAISAFLLAYLKVRVVNVCRPRKLSA